jgi:hypothetical protein
MTLAMSNRRAGLRKSTLAALVLLPPLAALVIYNSFQLSTFECTVCIAFEGREVCRTVTGQTREEGLQSATNNTCALLTSGMTDSIRCSRTVPSRAECVPAGSSGAERPKLGAF